MTEQRRNKALLWAWIITLPAFLLNLPLFFFQFPGQQLLPWLALAAFVAALALCVTALPRAFGQPQVYRGKISRSVVTVIAGLLFSLPAFGFFSPPKMPAPSPAPPPRQKAPPLPL